MLKGKTVVLGVTGSIAAYKMAKSYQHADKTTLRCACNYDKKCDQYY